MANRKSSSRTRSREARQIANCFLVCFFVLLLSTFYFLIPVSFAAYEWEVPLPPAPGGATLSTDSIDSLFTYVYNFALGLGGLLAFFRLVYAGILWGSEGSGIAQKANAMDVIKNSIFGLLLLLFSWVILNTINPQILNLNLSVSKTDTTRTKTFAGVFDSLVSSNQRQSLDEVLKHISRTYLIQTKPDLIAAVDDSSLSIFQKNLKLLTGIGQGTSCETADAMSLYHSGISCVDSLSQVFNCYTPLSCVLINDLLELKEIIDFQVITGSDYGSHAEARAVDIKLRDLSQDRIDPRDEAAMSFLGAKKNQCGDELFAPAKFGDSCYFMSSGQASSTCSYLDNQIHYSIKQSCL